MGTVNQKFRSDHFTIILVELVFFCEHKFSITLELGKIARAYRSDPYLTIPIYARYWYRIRKSHISYDIPDFGDSAGVRAWIWCPLVTIGGSGGLL